MRVTFDLAQCQPAQCQDHGQCAFPAPAVFVLDESLRDGVEEAADACPLQAITVED